MLLTNEVIEVADRVENTLQLMGEVDRIAGLDAEYRTSAGCLDVHNSTLGIPLPATLRSEFYTNSQYYGQNKQSRISVELHAWLAYSTKEEMDRPAQILQSASNKVSIHMFTNRKSTEIVLKQSLNKVDRTIPYYNIGTPDCDELLFLHSLEYNDLYMNALLFQYEWRRRKGRDILIRFGVDPLQSTKELERIAREAYEHYRQKRDS